MLAWLSVWSEMQTCIWPSWCHCHLLSLAPVKSRLVLPFWYRLTQVVPDKRPLNGCVCVCVCVRAHVCTHVCVCAEWEKFLFNQIRLRIIGAIIWPNTDRLHLIAVMWCDVVIIVDIIYVCSNLSLSQTSFRSTLHYLKEFSYWWTYSGPLFIISIIATCVQIFFQNNCVYVLGIYWNFKWTNSIRPQFITFMLPTNFGLCICANFM